MVVVFNQCFALLNLIKNKQLRLVLRLLNPTQVTGMKRFALAAIILTMAAAGFGQPQGQPQQPWSEQLPIPQYPQAGPGPQAPQLGAPQGAPEDDGSAPDRGVARVSSMNGNVSVRRGDSGEMVAAVVNAPLVAGDRIVTSDTGRAEVQLPCSTM